MPEHIYNLYEAKTNLSKLVERAARGECVVIANAGRPMAKLVPATARMKKPRPGRWKGKVEIADDFDAPLPEQVAAAFGCGDEK